MKIDPQKQFLCYRKNCFVFTDWQEIAQQKRVLLVNVTRPKAHFVPIYVQHLNVWSMIYKQWGVDQVYLTTRADKYNILAVNAMAKQLPVLGDVEGELALALADHCGIHGHSSDVLSRYWNYQVLINQGQIEQMYYQPMDNLVKTFLKDTKNTFLAKQLLAHERFHLTPFFLRNAGWAMQNILYYRLYPNVDLKNYLLNTAR